MQKKTEIIGWSSLSFWITLGIILFFLLPYFKNMFYNPDNAKSWLERLKQEELIYQDTTQIPVDTTRQPIDKIFITWAWDDYHGTHHEIGFNINSMDTIKAVDFRKSYSQSAEISQLYYDFIRVSSAPLDSMCSSLISDIRKKGLLGQDVLDYVVSAIQYPTYTKITPNAECPCFDMGRNWSKDCLPKKDGTGCCNLVYPMGVYTPTEFIYKKTGDCDTKALIAYALLKKMGYKSALLLGQVSGGYHAMLGLAEVNPVIPSRYVRHNNRVYYPWEVTGDYNGDCRLGNMNMWSVWLNWEAVCD
jgi:hypothetical protein